MTLAQLVDDKEKERNKKKEPNNDGQGHQNVPKEIQHDLASL